MFVLWLFCYPRLKLRSPQVPKSLTVMLGGVILMVKIMLRILRHAHPPVLFRASVEIPACCQSLGLTLSWRDLSLGAPPALCCAPLVEEVLVYCLHDLVKYVYMNDDQLV